MCNNNGHCRKFDAGTMCPSFRVTRDERDSTRGRANSLRLALSGQLGPEALVSDEMYATMELCVSLQGLQARVPDRRRHGRDENRVPASISPAAKSAPCATSSSHISRAMRRLLARLRATRQSAQRRAGLPALGEALLGFAARRSAAALASRLLRQPRRAAPQARRGHGRRRRPRGRVARGYLQPLFRARELARRGARARSSGLPSLACRPGRRRAAAVLRANLSRDGHDRRSPRRSTPHADGAHAVRRTRGADRGPRAVVHSRPAGRVPHAPAGHRKRCTGRDRPHLRGVHRRASTRQARCGCRCASRRMRARSSTGIATRRLSESCRQSSPR